MAEEVYNQTNYLLSEFNTKLRDLEERGRILKERVMLIGQNLLESREENENDILELKKSSEEIKQDLKMIKSRLQRISEETSNFARKEDLAMVYRQLKMLKPIAGKRQDKET